MSPETAPSNAPDPALARVRIVLVAPSHPGNIGAAARAMRTMGLTSLHLVTPREFPHAETTALAAGADDVLAGAVVHATLDAALARCVLAMGCTARLRGVQLPSLGPRECAPRLLAAAAGGEVALVFGNERTGLTNDELQRCAAAVHVPTDPEFSSLNLAAAVQVLCYELRVAAFAGAPAAAGGGDAAAADDDPPATLQQMEGLFGHLARLLDDIDFHKGRLPETIMRRLRRLLFRATPSEREVLILRGIFTEAQRSARLASGAGTQGSSAPVEHSGEGPGDKA
jgi:tRNA (cytidine32/uridine32-2'-O)-methyltransferase